MKYEDQDPMKKLHAGEPYFLIRGQDKFAVGAVSGYGQALAEEAMRLKERGDDEGAEHLRQMVAEISVVAEYISVWQDDNADLVKTPD